MYLAKKIENKPTKEKKENPNKQRKKAINDTFIDARRAIRIRKAKSFSDIELDMV